MSGSVRVDGLNKLLRDVQALGVEVDDLKTVFGDLAARGANLAASFAPRRSGKLAASIRGSKSKNKATITAGKASVKYAAPINFGWPKRGIKAALFMQKADAQLAPDAAQEIDAALTKLIRDRGLA